MEEENHPPNSLPFFEGDIRYVTLHKTNSSSPLKIGGKKRKRKPDPLPTIHFQGQAVRFIIKQPNCWIFLWLCLSKFSKNGIFPVIHIIVSIWESSPKVGVDRTSGCKEMILAFFIDVPI